MLTKLHMLQDVHGHWDPAMRNASRWAQIAYHSRSNDGECRCVLVRLSKVWYDRWVFELIDHKELTAYVPAQELVLGNDDFIVMWYGCGLLMEQRDLCIDGRQLEMYYQNRRMRTPLPDDGSPVASGVPYPEKAKQKTARPPSPSLVRGRHLAVWADGTTTESVGSANMPVRGVRLTMAGITTAVTPASTEAGAEEVRSILRYGPPLRRPLAIRRDRANVPLLMRMNEHRKTPYPKRRKCFRPPTPTLCAA